MRRKHGFAWVAALALLLVSTAWAQSPRTEGDRAGAQGVYDAEVTVNGQGESERNNAFARALGTVLAKLSGDRSAAGRPGVGAELRNAKNYVASYDYRQDQGTSPNGAPTFRSTLVVRFTPSEVDSLINALGLPIWPQPRPKPVVWMAIDDGSGPRLVGLNQTNAAKPLLNRAVERGYKLGLPTGNAAEQALVGAIWRQDTAAVARASAKYSPPMQLLGKLYRGKDVWVADWVFVDKGKVLSKWTSKNADARAAMAAGADGTAEALMKRYGKRGSSGPAGTYRVVFTGIDSSDDYLRLSAALQGMSVVRRITPVRASGSTLEVDLELLTGLSGFKRTLGGDSPLQGGEGEPPVYHLK
ncbi:DUF2066 domain-containing protein [Pseudoxanthomonas gei]|uniref:DUF2066 domain-containing protein n=1 Tax=Pseudoxanthomonas gei TaxID=1383030 RepID=A0ABX0AFB1_9GAMM|nr:DUF2066 domain-containing protein [Pseudoxanthomonas gei]